MPDGGRVEPAAEVRGGPVQTEEAKVDRVRGSLKTVVRL